MQRKSTCFITAAAVAFASATATPVHAQAYHTFVSGLGDDTQPCSRGAPCKTFATALSKTAAGGEINCVDNGGYGPVTITKSITIDCSGAKATILAPSTTGVNINVDVVSGLIVRLRNLYINGLLNINPSRGIAIVGTTNNDNAISIENCVIDGFTTNGIIDSAKNGRLLIKDTVVRNNYGPAVTIASASGTSSVKATLDNVSTFDSGFGFAFGNGAQALIKNSIASQHVTAGVQADAGATVAIVSSVILGNPTGISANAGSNVRVRSSDISYNTTSNGGAIQSHIDNSFFANGAAGPVNPAAGGVTSPQGLQ